jgi:hypothetical protein
VENLKIYLYIILAFLFFQLGLAQSNDSHIVKAPTKELKMILYSNGKPIVEGNVVIVGDRLINHGMFVVYRQDGFILQTIHYNMGRIIKITNFSEQERI